MESFTEKQTTKDHLLRMTLDIVLGRTILSQAIFVVNKVFCVSAHMCVFLRVCVCVCMCTLVYVNILVCAGAKDNLKCHSLGRVDFYLSLRWSLSLAHNSPSRPASGICLSLPHQNWDYKCGWQHLDFLREVRVHVLSRQVLYWLSCLPSPKVSYYNI